MLLCTNKIERKISEESEYGLDTRIVTSNGSMNDGKEVLVILALYISLDERFKCKKNTL